MRILGRESWDIWSRVLQIVGGVSTVITMLWFNGLYVSYTSRRPLRASARARMDFPTPLDAGLLRNLRGESATPSIIQLGLVVLLGSLGWYVDSATSRKERAMEKETILTRNWEYRPPMAPHEDPSTSPENQHTAVSRGEVNAWITGARSRNANAARALSHRNAGDLSGCSLIARKKSGTSNMRQRIERMAPTENAQ